MRGLSLERELPLLITALLLAIIAVALALTYREVRSSAMHGAAAALQRATRELAAAVDVRAAARLQQQREVAADPAVRRALGGEPIDTHAVHMAIDRLAVPGDSGLLNELWSTAGRRLIGWGAETLPEGSSRPAAVLAMTIGAVMSPRRTIPGPDRPADPSAASRARGPCLPLRV